MGMAWAVRGGQGSKPRRHAGALVAVAVAACLIVLGVVANPTNAAPPRSKTISFLGLQLTVPSSWAVGYFVDCPDPNRNQLLIGQAARVSSCPGGSGTRQQGNTVYVYQTHLSAPPAMYVVRGFVVHGLTVNRITTNAFSPDPFWVVPAYGVGITTSGRVAKQVIHSLARATPRAHPSPGQIKGTETLATLTSSPITGPVRITHAGRVHRAMVTSSTNGFFAAVLRPGVYEVVGYDGTATCPPSRVTVVSGATTTVRVECQGE
jgi:hypothetical protein